MDAGFRPWVLSITCFAAHASGDTAGRMGGFTTSKTRPAASLWGSGQETMMHEIQIGQARFVQSGFQLYNHSDAVVDAASKAE